MAALSNTYETGVLNHLFGGTPLTAPSEWHIAMYTTATDDDSGGTEVTGGGYARVNYSGGWTVTNDTVTNDADISFPQATGDWSAGAAITHTRVFDAAAGSPMIHGALTNQTKTVANGDDPSFPAGTFQFTLD